MTQRIFTEVDRKAFAGLLPFAPGASVPFTPEAFESVEVGLRPVFHIRPYSREARAAMDKEGWSRESIAAGMDGGAVVRWENLASLPDGAEVPYGAGVLVSLPDVVFYQLHTRISLLTVGPTKEEKEALK